MTQLSVAARNARLQALIDEVDATPIVRIYTGSAPANCAAAATGTLLLEYTLDTSWCGSPSSGGCSLTGLPLDDQALDDGDAGHYRIYKADGTTCVVQGACSGPSGGGEIVLDVVGMVTDQVVNLVSGTLTEAGA